MISNNLLRRVISGLIITFGGLCYIYLAPENVFIIISIALAIIANYEFSRALIKKGIPVKFSVTCLLTMLFVSFLWFVWKGPAITALIFGASTVAATLFFSLGRADKIKLFFWYLLSLVWIAFPIALLVWFRFGGYYSPASDLILFLVIIVSFNDIFAYFGGKALGKRPLASVISPNKTIEGSLFGLAAGVISGFVLSALYPPLFVSFWKLLALITVVIVCSQAGDLLESKFKRYCQVKDSGNIIPGHGGLLDRVDSYLLAIPVFTVLARVMEIGM